MQAVRSKRTPRQQMTLDQIRELVVDNFAGGGGASTGIARAIGRSVDIAINHNAVAIAMHKVNHPETKHFLESVWEVDPRKVTQGQPVGLCWLSPDCTHFSKAKGGKPVSKKIRGLAWIAVRWAATAKPRVIILENVEEFVTWGPLIASRDPSTGRLLKKVPGEDGERCEIVIAEPDEKVPPELLVMHPDPKRKGREFKSFVNALKRQGYHVEWRELRACDYGAPTIRKRLFLIARCDDCPIMWPPPTHGDPKSEAVKSGRLQPWRTAAEIIDWSIPCPSIFDRKRPLAENTMRRIARGIHKFVLENPQPFVIKVNHSKDDTFRGQAANEPMQTITAKNGWGIVCPVISRQFGKSVGHAANEPLGTVTAGGGGKSQLVTAFLAPYHSETANSKVRGQALDRPLLTQDTSNRYALVTSHLIKMYGTNIGQKTDEPLHTVTTKHRLGLVTVHGQDYQIVDIGMRMLEPRELFNAQGFPGDYIIDKDAEGNRFSKAAQVARCGNAVPPNFAEALVRANLPELCGNAPAAVASM